MSNNLELYNTLTQIINTHARLVKKGSLKVLSLRKVLVECFLTGKSFVVGFYTEPVMSGSSSIWRTFY